MMHRIAAAPGRSFFANACAATRRSPTQLRPAEIGKCPVEGSCIEAVEFLPREPRESRGRASRRCRQLVLRDLQHRRRGVRREHLHPAVREPQRIFARAAVHLEDARAGRESSGAARPHGSAHHRTDGGCGELTVVGVGHRVECGDAVRQLRPPFPSRPPASIRAPGLQLPAAQPLRRDSRFRCEQRPPRSSATNRPAYSSRGNGVP